MLPISVAEGEGFNELVQYFQYVMPLRALVTKHIEKHFEDKKDERKSKLAGADKLALTVSCWTALTITATCHFITADWRCSPVCCSAQINQLVTS